MRFTIKSIVFICILLAVPFLIFAQSNGNDNPGRFNTLDIFELEYASDPQISPDGGQIVYVRNFMDIMLDRARSNLWIVNFDDTGSMPLTSGNNNYSSPRWSPDGNRLLYSSNADGSSQLYMRWMDTGHTAKIKNFTKTAGNITWSPDGHASAPTAVSMLHAGVLMKLGGYGCLRVAMFLLPEAASEMAWIFIILTGTSVIYGALGAIRQTDLKYINAYSSVSHCG